MESESPYIFFIPVYNDVEVLDRCLKSIKSLLGQELIHEIIVIENKSHKAKEICNKNGVSHEWIAKKSRSMARNHALSKPKNKIYCFIDADVVLENNWLIKFHKEYFKENRNLVYSGNLEFDAKKMNSIRNYKKELSRLYLPYLNSSCMVVSGKVFHKVNGFDERFARGEDTDISIRISKNVPALHGTSKPSGIVFYNHSRLRYLLIRSVRCTYSLAKIFSHHQMYPKKSYSLFSLLKKWDVKKRLIKNPLQACYVIFEFCSFSFFRLFFSNLENKKNSLKAIVVNRQFYFFDNKWCMYIEDNRIKTIFNHTYGIIRSVEDSPSWWKACKVIEDLKMMKKIEIDQKTLELLVEYGVLLKVENLYET